MNKRRIQSSTLLIYILLLLLGGICILWLWAQQRQYALNRQLIAALAKNDTRQALILVNEGADPNTRCKPMSAPSLSGLVKQLLHRTPPPVNDTPTAFMIACGTPFYYDPWSDYVAMWNHLDDSPLVAAMLAHGANINVRTMYGRTPLMFAINFYRPKTVLWLLKHGANVDLQDEQGNTALHLALFRVRPELMLLLLKYRANVNLQDKDGRTVLYNAMGVGVDKDIVRQLLAHGANPNLADIHGRTPLMEAHRYVRPTIETLLRQAGARK